MPCSVDLACVDPGQVGMIWPRVAPRLRRAIRRTGLSAFADIERDVLAGRALLWLALSGASGAAAIDAVAATRLELTETGMVCVITACEGQTMARWLAAHLRHRNPTRRQKAVAACASTAVEAGCARSTAIGRRM